MQDANKTKEKLQEILNGKEYQAYYNEPTNIFATWWEKAKKWIAEQLANLFPSMESAGNASGPLLIIMILIIIALLGFVILFLIRNSKMKRQFRDQKPLQSVNEMNWSYERHLSEARRLEILEDYTQSTRHLFLALLLFFHEKEWLEARIWKTNWEYYDELRKINKQWANQFYHHALLFDGATYGKYVVQKEEYDKFQTEAMRWLNEMNELGNEKKGGE